MPVVYEAKPQQHGLVSGVSPHPENFLRPQEEVFNLDWEPDDVKPAAFVARQYGHPGDVSEDWTKKNKLTRRRLAKR